MSKPSILYHASPNKNIDVFEPRNEHVRDINEGPVVFATPHVDLASCFLFENDDSWVSISRFNSVQVIIVSDRERFEREDHGGVIYELPSDTFVHEIRGGAKDEWTSRVSAKPTGKTEYKSALEAMLEHGVQVYFVDKSIFVKINNSKDNGMATLRTLDSENSVKNVNISGLPKGDFGE